MKLVKFNTSTVEGGRIKRPTITIGKKGSITFSLLIASTMQLKEKEKLSLVHDDEEPGDWYVMRDPEGFPIREVKGGTFIFQSAQLCHIIREQLGLSEEDTHKFPMALEPTKSGKQELWAVLTAGATNEEESKEEEEEEEKEEEND